MHALPAIRASSLSSSSVGRPVASGKGMKKSGKRRWNTSTSRRRGRASGRRPGKGRGVLRFEKLRDDDDEDYDDDNNCKDEYMNYSGWTGEGCQNLQA